MNVRDIRRPNAAGTGDFLQRPFRNGIKHVPAKRPVAQVLRAEDRDEFPCEPVSCEDVVGVALANDGGIMNRDRKSTRLNSSHGYISYAVFCLKKKKKNC